MEILLLHVLEITDFDKFAKLRQKWNTILNNSNDDSLFLTWEQFSISAMNLNRNQKLRILYIKDKEKIIAIAPLRKSFYSINNFQFNVIEPLDLGSSTDYTGLIFAEKETECLLMFLKYLYLQNDWDFIHLSDIPENSIIIDIIKQNPNLFPNFILKLGAICPYIKIPDSMKKFLGRYSNNFRKNLRKSYRNLERDFGKIELINNYEFGSIDKAMKIFFDLHQKRWLSINQPGAFQSNKVKDIFLKRAKLFAEKGWFKLFFLVVNKIPIAAKYVLEYNKKIYGCLSGFDTRYHSYGPGNLLLAKIIENAIERKFIEYDFMKGNELYKSKWTKNFRRNMNIECINNKFRSHFLSLSLRIGKKLKINFLE